MKFGTDIVLKLYFGLSYRELTWGHCIFLNCILLKTHSVTEVRWIGQLTIVICMKHFVLEFHTRIMICGLDFLTSIILYELTSISFNFTSKTYFWYSDVCMITPLIICSHMDTGYYFCATFVYRAHKLKTRPDDNFGDTFRQWWSGNKISATRWDPSI